MLHASLQKIVENICSLGCIRVNEIIKLLERGENVPGMPALSAADNAALIGELKSIMSAYDKPI